MTSISRNAASLALAAVLCVLSLSVSSASEKGQPFTSAFREALADIDGLLGGVECKKPDFEACVE